MYVWIINISSFLSFIITQSIMLFKEAFLRCTIDSLNLCFNNDKFYINKKNVIGMRKNEGYQQ